MQVVFRDMSIQYYSQIVWARCANFAAKVKFQLEQVMHYKGVDTVPSNNASLILSSFLNLTAPVIDINNNETGAYTSYCPSKILHQARDTRWAGS